MAHQVKLLLNRAGCKKLLSTSGKHYLCSRKVTLKGQQWIQAPSQKKLKMTGRQVLYPLLCSLTICSARIMLNKNRGQSLQAITLTISHVSAFLMYKGPLPGYCAGWEDNLSQLSPQKQEVTKQAALTRRFPAAARSGPALPRPKPAAAARSENGRGAADSGSETDDVELPFDGRHILEIIGLTAATTTNDLEGFLSSINTHVLEPAVRYAPICFACTCGTACFVENLLTEHNGWQLQTIHC